MNKSKRFLAALLILVMAVLTFTACKKVDEEGDVTVVVEKEDGSYEVYKTYLENVENKKEGVVGVLENLRDREEEPLNVKMSDGTYGKFVSEIGSIKEDSSAKKYITVYTSLESEFGTWDGVGVLEYEGKTLKTSGFGISSMSVTSGTIILFRLEASQW